MSANVKFSDICGENVELSEDKKVATWISKNSDGWACSEAQLKPGEVVEVKVEGSGRCDVGFMKDEQTPISFKTLNEIHARRTTLIIEVTLKENGDEITSKIGNGISTKKIEKETKVWIAIYIRYGEMSVELMTKGNPQSNLKFSFAKHGTNIKLENDNTQATSVSKNPASICFISEQLEVGGTLHLSCEPEKEWDMQHSQYELRLHVSEKDPSTLKNEFKYLFEASNVKRSDSPFTTVASLGKDECKGDMTITLVDSKTLDHKTASGLTTTNLNLKAENGVWVVLGLYRVKVQAVNYEAISGAVGGSVGVQGFKLVKHDWKIGHIFETGALPIPNIPGARLMPRRHFKVFGTTFEQCEEKKEDNSQTKVDCEGSSTTYFRRFRHRHLIPDRIHRHEGMREEASFCPFNAERQARSPGHIIYATCVDFKTSLQDRIPKVKYITIDFEPPSSCVEDVICRHTLTSDNVDILMNHAVHSENAQRIELRNLSFGQKTVSCTFSTFDCLFIRNSLADRYTPKLAYLTLLEPDLKHINFDKSDVEVEHNVYARSIILDYICYTLVKSHEDVVEAYPSTKENTFVLIAFTKNDNDYQELETFNGLQVLCRPYLTKSSESILAENYAQEQGLHCSFGKDIELLNEVIELNTGELFTDHSNIEGIGLSMVRSTSKGFDTSSPCVVLYCKCKSYIPFGEQEFPKYLIHQSGLSFKTDVREGRFSFGPNGNTLLGVAKDWHKELAMGCSVGPKSGQYDATIGPFVKVEGIDQTCFLTVRHMFQPFDLDDRRLQGTKLVQPADGDTKPDPYSQAGHGGPGYDRECGEVLTSAFSERVDAAVVKIKADRSPNRGYFVVPTENELKVAGFSHTNFPAFDDGSVMNATAFTTENFATERVVKFGKTTGLTKGSLELNSMAVKVVDEEALAIQYNGRLVSKVMKKQLKVNSHSLKTFFQLGDSGSAVFLVDKQNKLHCIGMAIGSMSDLSCLVTPIHVVLSELEKKLGKKILLKNFEMEKMQ